MEKPNPRLESFGSSKTGNSSHTGTHEALTKFNKQRTISRIASFKSYSSTAVVKRHEKTLKAIRGLQRIESQTWRKYLYYLVKFPWAPQTSQLLDLVQYYYPPRAALPVQVCDIYSSHAVVREVAMGNIEAEWFEKPDDVVVRWIHAPVGTGLYHSTLEDLFREARPIGLPFTKAGPAGFPYVGLHLLNLRNRRDIENMRDVHCSLLNNDYPQLQSMLNDQIFTGNRNPNLQADLEWRAEHLAVDLEYRHLVTSDLPWQVADGLPIEGGSPLGHVKPNKRTRDYRILSEHPSFLDAQVVRNEFRGFHSNGFLFTMSAAKGITYIDSRLHEYLDSSPDSMLSNPDASAIANCLREFKDTGVETWHRPTAEWLLVHIMTELACCPHQHRQGNNHISMMEAYHDILHDLRLQTFDPWKRNETVALTRKFILLIQEIKYIQGIFKKNRAMLQNLQLDVLDHERLSLTQTPSYTVNSEGVTSESRIQWTVDVIDEILVDGDKVLSEAEQAMEILLQLRTIEQNELSIIQDGHQRAIMVFTAVTVVFLPLSFCTSYFGMNLRGIVDTSKSQSYFWAVCGSTGLAIVVVLSLYAFWNSIGYYFHGLASRWQFGQRNGDVEAQGR